MTTFYTYGVHDTIPTRTITVRRPTVLVERSENPANAGVVGTISYATVDRPVVSAKVSFGLDQRIGRATFVCAAKPTLGHDDFIRISMDAGSHGTAADRWRFVGVVREITYDGRTGMTTVECYGLLIYLVEWENGEDPSYLGGILIYDLLGTATGTAKAVIQAILDKVFQRYGTALYSTSDIYSSAIVYGFYDDAFLWSNGTNSQNIDLTEEGESAMSQVEKFDEIDCDFTYSSGPGQRYRLIETLPNPSTGYSIGRWGIAAGSPSAAEEFTLTGGYGATAGVADILEGQFTDSVKDTKNRYVVTGYDIGDGGGPEYFILETNNALQGDSNTNVGTGGSAANKKHYHTKRFHSNLIERSNNADSGTGQCAETLANVLSLEYNRTLVTGYVVTHRDDRFGVGQVHKVQGGPAGATGFIGVAQKFLLVGLDISIDKAGLRQRLQYLGGGVPA